jgi:hypothetical protein
MTRLSLALCGLLLAALPSTASRADTLSFSFGFSNSDFSGSGVLIADSTNVAGVYQVIDASGNIFVDGITDKISGVLAVGSFPADGPNDNLLYFPELNSPEGAFDEFGVSFKLAGDAGKVNLFLSDGEDLKLTGGKQDEKIGEISVAPVPEPEALTLVGTGVLGLAGLVRRRLAA